MVIYKHIEQYRPKDPSWWYSSHDFTRGAVRGAHFKSLYGPSNMAKHTFEAISIQSIGFQSSYQKIVLDAIIGLGKIHYYSTKNSRSIETFSSRLNCIK